MILDNLPTTEGQPVYALAEQVFTYSEPDINTILGDDVKTAGNDGIFWASGAAIGTFTGEKTIVGNTVWYKLNSTVYIKEPSLFQWRAKYASYKKNGSYNPVPGASWFQGSQITTKDKATLTAEAKKAADDEFQNQLNAINGPAVGDGTGTGSPAPTATAGSTVFGTGTSSTNMILIIASVLTFGLLALILSKAKKKKQNQMNQSSPAVYQVPPGFVENIKTTKRR
jgi:hypothetical protein